MKLFFLRLKILYECILIEIPPLMARKRQNVLFDYFPEGDAALRRATSS